MDRRPRLPYVGAVIRYAYLWRRDAVRGATTARKDRPCVILAGRATDDGLRLYVAPITRTAQPVERSIRLTPRTRQHLGLDAATPSWLVVDEVNVFVWRSADVVPVAPGTDHYGALPASLAARAKARFDALADARRAGAVPRS